MGQPWPHGRSSSSVDAPPPPAVTSYTHSTCSLRHDSISVYLNEGGSVVWNHRHGKMSVRSSTSPCGSSRREPPVMQQGIGVQEGNTMNEGDNRGRIFMLNDDMTVSPVCAPHLVLDANFHKQVLFSRLSDGLNWAGTTSRRTGSKGLFRGKESPPGIV